MELLKFFIDYNISYVEEGKNVSGTDININCRLCGDDPSEHLGIDPEKIIWHCWRNNDHKGAGFANLIRMILGCSFSKAKLIASKYDGKEIIEDEDFYQYAQNILDGEPETNKKVVSKKDLEFPEEFKFLQRSRLSRVFFDYLTNRGILNADHTAERFDLHYALSGKSRYRIIIPVFLYGRLVSWTSRTISTSGTSLRYQDLSMEESVLPLKSLIFDYDYLSSSNFEGDGILWVVEGPLDALVFSQFLPVDQAVTCIFTRTIRTSQVRLFFSLRKKFKEVRILLDSDAGSHALKVCGELDFFQKVCVFTLPMGVSDPGEFTFETASKLVSK